MIRICVDRVRTSSSRHSQKILSWGFLVAWTLVKIWQKNYVRLFEFQTQNPNSKPRLKLLNSENPVLGDDFHVTSKIFLLSSQFYWHIHLKSTAYFFDPPSRDCDVTLPHAYNLHSSVELKRIPKLTQSKMCLCQYDATWTGRALKIALQLYCVFVRHVRGHSEALCCLFQ